MLMGRVSPLIGPVPLLTVPVRSLNDCFALLYCPVPTLDGPVKSLFSVISVIVEGFTKGIDVIGDDSSMMVSEVVVSTEIV
jgi:hypothetical protein